MYEIRLLIKSIAKDVILSLGNPSILEKKGKYESNMKLSIRCVLLLWRFSIERDSLCRRFYLIDKCIVVVVIVHALFEFPLDECNCGWCLDWFCFCLSRWNANLIELLWLTIRNEMSKKKRIYFSLLCIDAWWKCQWLFFLSALPCDGKLINFIPMQWNCGEWRHRCSCTYRHTNGRHFEHVNCGKRKRNHDFRSSFHIFGVPISSDRQCKASAKMSPLLLYLLCSIYGFTFLDFVSHICYFYNGTYARDGGKWRGKERRTLRV